MAEDVAVVTGGAGGLGRAFVAELRSAGYDVVPVDITGSDRVLDVTDAEACRALADEVRPAVWVNNAGITGAGDLLDHSDEYVRRLVDVNLMGVINGTRAALGPMTAASRGSILNIASLSGWAPTPHLGVYSATKHGVRAFSVATSAEVRSSGVSVQCLLPDGIRTPMVDPTKPEQLMSFTGKRLLEPDEVAAAGMRLLASNRIVASVPRTRSATVPLLGLVPRLAFRLLPFIERRARRNRELQERSLVTRGGGDATTPGASAR
ncbi:MAG: SDR family oxidoreductase [Acidimicrobiia bacterium]